MTGEIFSIGELARRTSTKVETIRWYERTGLLDAPETLDSHWITCASCCVFPTSVTDRARKST
jgi:hypothetical protein